MHRANVISANDVSPEGRAPRPDAREPWVLVVDDDEATRSALAEMLTEFGLRVTTAEDGEEALSLVRHRMPKVALVDLVMPRRDGWSFISALRQLPGGKDVAVVSMTAHGGAALARAPVSQGYLAKPVSLDRLLDTVARLGG